ncbi:uncharacterized protein [Nicotiana tomentosiformis]|uniref:uncharacterized protein n=1 Tax=Nicotiana tomentosiformis TaxID=4098 RepID=UPI00388C676E
MLCDDATAAQMPDIVPRLKEWVEGIVSQRPYSKHLWHELSKGQWEARNHGLPKDVEMRPSSADDDIYADPLALKQDKEKKRRKSLSSSSREKKRPRKRLARKPKNASILELSSNSLHQLMDESEEKEEDYELVARASVIHHEAFLRYREEFKCHEAEAWELAEKKDTFKLLNEKLQAELQAAWKEHADLVVQLNSSVSGQEALTTDLEAAKLEVVVSKTKAEEKMAHFKADVEAIQEQARNMVKHMGWQSRRETLEGVHAQSFDVLAEIENAKICEDKARKMAYPEEDSEGSDGGEESIGDDVSPDDD